jgi:hypothetical protein
MDPNLATTLGYDPSYDWFHYSMVQAWMGKAKVTVGSLTGQPLYDAVFKALDQSCPATAGGGEGHCLISKTNGYTDLYSKCLWTWPAGIVSCNFLNIPCESHLY